MLRDVTSDQMVEALVDGVNHEQSARRRSRRVKPQSDQLASITEVDRRSSRKATSSRSTSSTARRRVSLNGAAKGTIPGEAFNKALTNAWLGDKPVQDDLKKAMLGG